MRATDARVPRGMRDLLPASMRRRQYVADVLRQTFESYGYEPLETPALEEAETLLGKYGPDAERLIYRAGLQERSNLALRYDLSVPLARVCATYDELARPFRRYQIERVWRGERPQRGRYREFVQADVDLVGSASMLADAEIITITLDVLDRLGFEDGQTKINNRKLLNGIGRYAGVPAPLLPGLYRAIDKLDKLGTAGLRLELRAVGLPADLLNRQRQAIERWMGGKADRDRLERDLSAAIGDGEPPSVTETALPAFLDALASFPAGEASDAAIHEARLTVMASSIDALRAAYPSDRLVPDEATDRLLDLLGLEGESRSLLSDVARRLDDAEAQEGVDELGRVLDALATTGVPDASLALDFAMVRGLEYYTGTIFETVVTRPPIGSITGGGRYDGLIGLFGRDEPAVGTSFGLDRLADVMDEVGLFATNVDAPAAEVLVTRFDEGSTAAAVGLAARLRAAGIRTEAYVELDRLGDQIRYAVKRGIPAVAIVGPDETAAGTVTVRDLARERQTTVTDSQVAALVRRIVDGDGDVE